MNQKPSPGRIVHFVLPSGPRAGEHRAAIITSTWDGPNQNLSVFHDQVTDDDGGAFNQIGRACSAPYDETGEQPGSWHFPERVPAEEAPAAGETIPAQPAAPQPTETPAKQPAVDPAPVEPAANNPA